MNAMAITTQTITDLMSIRALRDHAVRLSKSPGSTNRQITVILLDAAIERTLFSAAEYLGSSFGDRDNVDKPLQSLRQHGMKIKEGLETSRKRLHRARNLAQHASVGIDRDDLPGWVAATERLVTQIIQFAFSIDVDSLRRSEAIEDLEIRRLIDTAEDHLAEHNQMDAMTCIQDAYSQIFETWKKFAVASQSGLIPRPRVSDEFGIERGSDSMAVALQQVTLLTSISQDVGEAIWFLEARRNRQLLTEEEVERALAFVVAFAVTIEATPAARRVDRWDRSKRMERHVRASEDATPRIGEFSITAWGERTFVRFVVENVPNENDFDEWSETIQTELHRSVHGRNTQLDPNGSILISQVGEFPSQLELIERTLSRSRELMEARREEIRRAEQELNAARQALQAEIDEIVASGVPDWLSFTVETDLYRKADPLSVHFQIDHPMALKAEVGQVFQELGQQVFMMSEDSWRLRRFQPARIPEAIRALERALQVATLAFNEAQESESRALEPVLAELRSRGYQEREVKG